MPYACDCFPSEDGLKSGHARHGARGPDEESFRGAHSSHNKITQKHYVRDFEVSRSLGFYVPISIQVSACPRIRQEDLGPTPSGHLAAQYSCDGSPLARIEHGEDCREGRLATNGHPATWAAACGDCA
jgi:hypothetical protein